MTHDEENQDRIMTKDYSEICPKRNNGNNRIAKKRVSSLKTIKEQQQIMGALGHVHCQLYEAFVIYVANRFCSLCDLNNIVVLMKGKLGNHGSVETDMIVKGWLKQQSQVDLPGVIDPGHYSSLLSHVHEDFDYFSLVKAKMQSSRALMDSASFESDIHAALIDSSRCGNVQGMRALFDLYLRERILSRGSDQQQQFDGGASPPRFIIAAALSAACAGMSPSIEYFRQEWGFSRWSRSTENAEFQKDILMCAACSVDESTLRSVLEWIPPEIYEPEFLNRVRDVIKNRHAGNILTTSAHIILDILQRASFASQKKMREMATRAATPLP